MKQKNRWDRIMEAINSGAKDSELRKRFGLSDDAIGVYRKYAKHMQFGENGEHVDCVSTEAICAMASFNQLANTLDIF